MNSSVWMKEITMQAQIGSDSTGQFEPACFFVVAAIRLVA